MVERARREQTRARQQRLPYDAIWCVFDRDPGHADFDKAVAEARHEKFRVAVSVPSFEFWVLLHYSFTTRSFRACDEVMTEIRKHRPDYDMNPPGTLWREVISRRQTASQNARRAREQVAGEHANPSTQVHDLIEFLERLKRPGG